MAAKKTSRCWPGYEPVPGKEQHEQGSCRPKAESKSTSAEKDSRAKRRKQLDEWQAEHPGKRKSSAQHLSAPGSMKKSATTKKSTAKKKTAAKRTAKKTASKKRGS